MGDKDAYRAKYTWRTLHYTGLYIRVPKALHEAAQIHNRLAQLFLYVCVALFADLS